MPAPAPTTPPRARRRVWSDEQVSALTEGVMSDDRIQEALRFRDSRGLDPTSFAVLRTARRTESLTPLLALLDPPEAKEQTQLDQVLRLLEAIAEAQLRMEQRMVALECRLAGRFAASPLPPLPGRPGSRT